MGVLIPHSELIRLANMTATREPATVRFLHVSLLYIDIPTDFLILNLLSGVNGCVTYTKKNDRTQEKM